MSAPAMPDLARSLATFAREAPGLRRDPLLLRALELLADFAPAELGVVLRLDGGRFAVRAARGPAAGEGLVQRSLPTADSPALVAAIAAADPVVPPDGERRLLLQALGLPDGPACLVMALHLDDEPYGLLVLARRQPDGWTSTERAAVAAFADLIGLGLLKVRLAWRLWLHQQVLEERDEGRLAGGGRASAPLLERSRAPAMRNCVLLARQVAGGRTPVLLGGETGVGKEVVARAIHAWSDRSQEPFIAVNCAALPESLLESELFGHAAGAFSGATGARPGRFAAADGGTLLLDEVGELPPAAQATLLRVLQEGRFEPVGSDRTVAVDVRIIAATHRDLEAEVAAGRFRQDLWYRLSVFPIHLPPLRERREDIPLMAEAWLADRAADSGKGPWTLSAAAQERLLLHDWPGNVRELLNALERATILQPAGMLPVDFFPLRGRAAAAAAAPVAAPPPAAPAAPPTLVEREAEAIREALVRCRGRIYGPLGAAAELGLNPSTLQSRMKRLGIPRVPER